MLVRKIHTLYTPLPKVIHDRLFKIFKELSGKYANQYLDEKSYRAHLTVGSMVLEDEYTQRFIEMCESLLKGEKSFGVELTRFTRSLEGEYIFCDINEVAKRRLLNLRERFFEMGKGIHKIEILQKYLLNWHMYTERERFLLKTTGTPYEFEPHVSVVKLNPIDTAKAIEGLGGKGILGKKFKVKEFMLSSQSEDPKDQYPIVKVIKVN